MVRVKIIYFKLWKSNNFTITKINWQLTLINYHRNLKPEQDHKKLTVKIIILNNLLLKITVNA